MGGSRGSDSDLLNVAEIFGNLTGLHFGLGDITNYVDIDLVDLLY